MTSVLLHLPGKHSQKRHAGAGRGAAVGRPVSDDELETGTITKDGQEVSDMFDDDSIFFAEAGGLDTNADVAELLANGIRDHPDLLHLSDDPDVREAMIARKAEDLQGSWETSSQYEPIQTAVRDEFGVAGGRHTGTSTVEDRTVLRAMYNETQSSAQSDGVTEMVVFRGLRDHERAGADGTVELDLPPASSWTASRAVAEDFSSQVAVTRIPIEQVLSVGGTGLGHRPEREVVVLGGKVRARVMDVGPLEFSEILLHLPGQHSQKRHAGAGRGAGGGGKVPGTPRSVLDYEKEIKDLPHERLAAFTPDGEKLFELDGDADSVEFTTDQIAELRAASERSGGLILTHNHPPDPDGRTIPGLSMNDLEIAMLTRATEVRAIDPDHGLFSMKPPPGERFGSDTWIGSFFPMDRNLPGAGLTDVFAAAVSGGFQPTAKSESMLNASAVQMNVSWYLGAVATGSRYTWDTRGTAKGNARKALVRDFFSAVERAGGYPNRTRTVWSEIARGDG